MQPFYSSPPPSIASATDPDIDPELLSLAQDGEEIPFDQLQKFVVSWEELMASSGGETLDVYTCTDLDPIPPQDPNVLIIVNETLYYSISDDIAIQDRSGE